MADAVSVLIRDLRTLEKPKTMAGHVRALRDLYTRWDAPPAFRRHRMQPLRNASRRPCMNSTACWTGWPAPPRTRRAEGEHSGGRRGDHGGGRHRDTTRA
ncbi:hypothetical protein [Methanogenium cariaci]|uniref:hypothetical protein n=1 Tax=Methanogenium cariaci TaxID=2197 RepID=UPI0012F6E767|nr:hypothetical protein [Methanogenium cariaci]